MNQATIIRNVLMAAALAATVSVFIAAIALWETIDAEHKVLDARRGCDCCEDRGDGH